MRIVSLLPSATETVFALGEGKSLVGRSEECDYPSQVRRLPVVMAARTLDQGAPSAEIDSRVRSVRGKGESLYEIRQDVLATLRPDVILTQDLCEVCSVTPLEVQESCARSGVAPSICTLSPTSLDEVWAGVATIGRAIGAAARGKRLAQALERRSARARRSRRPLPRVAVVEWLDPPILAGLWADDIVRRAGGHYLGPGCSERAERTTWEALHALGPDLVMLSPCSFSVTRTVRELGRLPDPWASFDPTPALGTWVADEAYFSRPGPRLADGVDLVRSLLRGRTPSRAPMPVRRWTWPRASS
jgi:iron complex transport system substrate-binding protein